MYTLVETGILNAVAAGVLAIVVLLIGRVVRRPAVMHALWVLVLLKLVTPPIVEIPIGLRMERLSSLADRGETTTPMLAHGRPTADPSRPVIVYMDSPESLSTALASAAGGAAVSSTEASSSWPRILARSLGNLTPWTVPILLGIWCAGTALWYVVQGWRITGFLRLISTARLATEDVQRQTQELAASIGARRAPPIWVLDATMSPTLWAFGSRACVIFPADLLDRVDAAARATLLTHELAHFRRGDHWVRLLEFAVTGLFWWHPAVWLARREIEIAEEHCCDAWVVSQFPGQPRRYAEALLDTIDFLSERPPRLVPVGSGLGQAPFLRQRIRLIMSGVAPKSMSGTTRLAVLTAAAVLLPLGPQLFEGAIRHADAALTLSSNHLDGAAARRIVVEPVLREASRRSEVPTQVEDELLRKRSAANVFPPTELEDPANRLAEVVPWAIVNSTEGRFQALAKTDGTLALRDTFQRRTFDLSEYQVSAIAFAPHRDLLAAGSVDGNVYLFDCASGHMVTSLQGHQAAIGSLAVSLDSRFVVSGSRDGIVKLWDIDDESEVPSRIPTQTSAINCVRFSSDGRLLAIACGDWMATNAGSVALWDLRGGTMKRRFQTSSPVGAIAFGEDQLVVAQWNGQTTRWNLRTGISEVAASVDKDTVSAAAFAADAQSILLDAASGKSTPSTAPVWFRQMDRDRDGLLGWNEFQGARGTFRRLDLDADEIVSWDEVTAFQ